MRVVADVGPQSMETHVEVDGKRLASDRVDMTSEPYRNTCLSVPLSPGRLEVEPGYNSWWNVGMHAAQDGRTVWESHPGKPIALSGSAAKMVASHSGQRGQMARMKANWPSIAADIAIGLRSLWWPSLPTSAQWRWLRRARALHWWWCSGS